MHTEILTPTEQAERSRQIIPARSPEHAAEMERQDREILRDLLHRRKRRVILPPKVGP